MQIGAERAIDPLTEDLVQIGRELTDGRGYDAVIEASGHVSAARQCVDLAGTYGNVILAGVYPEEADLAIKLFDLWWKELTVRSMLGAGPDSFPRALSMLPDLKLQPLIAEIVPLQEIAGVFAAGRTNTGVKYLVKP